MRLRLAATTLVLCACECACDEHKTTAIAGDATSAASAASAASADLRPAAEGCLRTASLEGVERDPACLLARPNEDAMRDIGKRVAMKLDLEPSTVSAGTMAAARLTITNTSAAEVLLVFDASTRGAGPRPDWSRLAGTPDLKADLPEMLRLAFPVTTLDAHDHNVDSMPLVAGEGAGAGATKWIGVRLKPGVKLTQSSSWWAMRIPAPLPIVHDDAGHRFVPKTAPVPLAAGEYTVTMDLPLHGVTPEERIVSTHVRVDAPPPK